MQDVFIEYLVKRKNTGKIMLAKLGVVLGVVLAVILLMTISPLLGGFSILVTAAMVGAVYGGYYLITSMNVEFEYAVTNGEIDIDRIIAMRKRRRLVTVNCREAEAFGRYRQAEHTQKSYQTRVFACDSMETPDAWYIVVRLKEKGRTLVVFNANDKMITAIKPFLPRPVMHEAFRTGAV